MAKIALHFEDLNGKIFFRADYDGGYDPASNAHRLANQVILWLDAQATEKINMSTDADPPVDSTIESNGHGIIWRPGEH